MLILTSSLFIFQLIVCMANAWVMINPAESTHDNSVDLFRILLRWKNT